MAISHTQVEVAPSEVGLTVDLILNSFALLINGHDVPGLARCISAPLHFDPPCGERDLVLMFAANLKLLNVSVARCTHGLKPVNIINIILTSLVRHSFTITLGCNVVCSH